jgi:glycine/D-amino acid oxidase-like deaminating enzyme/nitrite reductase/ring-hydroxylating ferredoxin subunit
MPDKQTSKTQSGRKLLTGLCMGEVLESGARGNCDHYCHSYARLRSRIDDSAVNPASRRHVVAGALAFHLQFTLAPLNRVMKANDGATVPVWGVIRPEPAAPDAAPPLEVEVAVIGAGIAGLTTAFLLRREGLDVTVFDEGAPGSGQTGRTSAHLSSVLDDRFDLLERARGVGISTVFHDSHASAIAEIERIVREEGIDCNFRRLDGYLFTGSDGDAEVVEREYDAARRAGAGVERVANGAVLPGQPQLAGPALRFAGQATFDPAAYLAGLLRAATQQGVRLSLGRRVVDVKGAGAGPEDRAEVTIEGGHVVRARHVVVATNVPSPLNAWVGIYLKEAAYRTYVVAFEVPRGSVADALYWDTHDPYHYVKLEPSRDGEHDLLVVGGEDHKTGQDGASPARFEALIEWSRRHFPAAAEVVARWSGQVVETGDGLAFIGRAPGAGENVYCVTGDSGMGLTHGTLGALIIRDLIFARPNPWVEAYSPTRKLVNLRLLGEVLNVGKQYLDLLSPGEVASEAELQPGQGAILRTGIHKLAVFRDEVGTVHRLNASCTHLKCVVHWNAVERSWDCPCHGSRFDCTGRVVMGPAIADLKPHAER